MVTRNYLLGVALIGLGLVALAAPARADFIVDGINVNTTGAVSGSIPSSGQTNDVFGITAPAADPFDWVYFGANLETVAAGQVRFDYVGAEAGYTNRMVLDGSVVYTHAGNGSPETFGKTAFSTAYAAGATVNFGFWVDGKSSGTLDVANGSNPVNDSSGMVNFAVAYLASDYTPTAGYFDGVTLQAGLVCAPG